MLTITTLQEHEAFPRKLTLKNDRKDNDKSI